MTMFEAVKNTLSTIVGAVTRKSYFTYDDGYPTYHHSKQDKLRIENVEKKKEERRQQVLSFAFEDMAQYDDLPFIWNNDLLYANEMAFLPLTDENKEIALLYIREVAKLIFDTAKIVPGARNCSISKKDIDFNYPINMTYPVPPCTFLECTPYTPTGKNSKYPVILHFRSSKIESFNGSLFQHHPIDGTIRILCDGQIGSAKVHFAESGPTYNKITFSMSLYGLSLVVKRVDDAYGNLYKFEDIK